jgi:hypothetical protein
MFVSLKKILNVLIEGCCFPCSNPSFNFNAIIRQYLERSYFNLFQIIDFSENEWKILNFSLFNKSLIGNRMNKIDRLFYFLLTNWL